MVIGVVIALISFVDFLTAMFLSSLLGLFYGFYAGPSMSMASDVSGNDESLSSASSILNLSSQSGGIVSPLIIGYSYSVFGSFKWGLITISLVSVFLMIISIHFLRRHGIT
jgi:MFS family permease